MRATKRKFACDYGGAAVEFAIVGPMLLVVLLGVLSYGGYFWMAHSVQQLANDSARAALGGLDAAERSALAHSVLAEEVSSYAYLAADNADVTVAEGEDAIVVRVTYDASDSPFYALSSLLPMPAAVIEQQAAVRLGGY